jgi:hypothetical protein
MAIFTFRADLSFFKLMVRHGIRKGGVRLYVSNKEKGIKPSITTPVHLLSQVLSLIFCQGSSLNAAGKRDRQNF